MAGFPGSGPSEPIRLYADDDRRVPKRVADQIREQLANDIASLRYAQDWAGFQRRVGIIEGLEIGLSYCQAVEDELSGKTTTKGR